MVAASLASLLKQTHLDDHEEILTAADSTLRQSKNDTEAQHVRVVALLKLDRFQDAIHTFENDGEELKRTARLEYAYALYKTGKPAQAAEVARQGASRGLQHVEAQASYRMEDFRRAAELYEQLGQRLDQDAEADLRINTTAVDAQLQWAGQDDAVHRKSEPRREDMDAFETMYNYGCNAIAQGKLGRAEVLLKRSRDLCNKLDSEEERDAEIPPIVVQLVYVLARLGKMEEAESLAKTIKPDGIPEKSTKYIAQVNSIASSQARSNPFLTQRMIAKDADSLKPDYPFGFQASIMKQNSYATDLQSLKFGGTADTTAEIIAKAAAPTIDAYYNSLSAVNAAAHARSQTGKEAFKHILPLLERRPNDVGLILTIVQLYVLTGNSTSATNLLERFLDRLEQSGSAAELDVRFAPGLVGALVSLYDTTRRRSQKRSELAKAAMHWRRKSEDRPTGVLHLLKSAGSALLESDEANHQKLAGEIFSELHQRDVRDRYAAAGLLAASSDTSNGSEANLLQPIHSLIADIDIDSLENGGIAQPPTAPATAAASRKRPAEDSKPKKSKKIRRSKLPKDYDPNKKPDPERWLPLRDRSTYRPKGKKGKARANLLSQGAAPTPADSDGSRPATPGAPSEILKAKQQQGGGAKKKKKGGKW
ncbi:hypothetical protein EJ03DRAFT_344671 [Teratosphaeria nubilosa]|uniref:Signal recognition particle subunit SRP72 n=1 Tax=Teratosphaeria nubilosa TaxID=161662 RepID=A0A6G1L481_9PEZI|nr:hypothetical protein EJ03DRAFT_344671 [Teratosphaeria nubilosa]